jgi:hypothetical protein
MGAERIVRENGDPQRSYITTQIRLLRQGDPAQRLLAVDQLASAPPNEAGRAAAALAGAVADEDDEIRERAANALLRLNARARRVPGGPLSAPLAQAIPALVDSLDRDDPRTRSAILRLFAELGGLAPSEPAGDLARAEALEPVAAPLIAALAAPDWRVRAAACRAAAVVLNRDHGAPADLLAAASDRNPYIREAAFESLLLPWSNTQEVERAVLPVLAAGTPEDRPRAAMVLGNHWPLSDRGMRGLLAPLSDPSAPWLTRSAVVHVLATLGPRAGAALPTLRAAAFDPRADQIDFGVARAMTVIDPTAPETLAVLQLVAERGIRPGHGEEAEWAAPLLRCSGPAAQALLPWLRGQAQCDDPEARAGACRLLAELGESPAVATGH